MRICIIPDCGRKHHIRGWCRTHHGRWLAHGDPLFTKRPTRGMTLADRFDFYTPERGRGCWEWQGHLNAYGYGMLYVSAGEQRMAHRYSYERYVGPIPEGLPLDHLCRNRSCVNYKHLEPVTHRVNIRRGEAPAANRARQTHCLRGHEFNETNTYIRPNRTRWCRTCARARDKRYYAEGTGRSRYKS